MYQSVYIYSLGQINKMTVAKGADLLKGRETHSTTPKGACISTLGQRDFPDGTKMYRSTQGDRSLTKGTDE